MKNHWCFQGAWYKQLVDDWFHHDTAKSNHVSKFNHTGHGHDTLISVWLFLFTILFFRYNAISWLQIRINYILDVIIFLILSLWYLIQRTGIGIWRYTALFTGFVQNTILNIVKEKSVPDLQIVAMTKRNRLSILYYSNPRYFDRFAISFGLLQKDSLDARKSHGFI